MNKLKDLYVGQKATTVKTFNQEEVTSFSHMSLDDNPVHFDPAYASETRFGKCIVQGPFVMSMIGGVLGSKLPGPGTIYINQETKFLNPVFVGETIQAHVEILSIREDKPVIELRTWIEKKDSLIAFDGKAVVYFIEE